MGTKKAKIKKLVKMEEENNSSCVTKTLCTIVHAYKPKNVLEMHNRVDCMSLGKKNQMGTRQGTVWNIV